MRLVVDSSVIVSAVKPDELLHAPSIQFFQEVRRRADEVWIPTTLLWEIGAALDHPDKTPKGTAFNRVFDVGLNFVPVDEGLFQRTWKADVRIPVKGADRIFLSCALEKQGLLISWDGGLVKHAGSAGVKAQTPDDYVRNP